MMRLRPETGDGVIAVEFVGRIDSADYQDFMPAFEDAIARAGAARALLDWNGFEGWTPEAESDAFITSISHSRTFERIAIVGPAKWHAEAAKLGEIFHGEMRFYEPAEEKAAWEWLRGD
jgi:hypothetical protein